MCQRGRGMAVFIPANCSLSSRRRFGQTYHPSDSATISRWENKGRVTWCQVATVHGRRLLLLLSMLEVAWFLNVGQDSRDTGYRGFCSQSSPCPLRWTKTWQNSATRHVILLPSDSSNLTRPCVCPDPFFLKPAGRSSMSEIFRHDGQNLTRTSHKITRQKESKKNPCRRRGPA